MLAHLARRSLYYRAWLPDGPREIDPTGTECGGIHRLEESRKGPGFESP